MVGYDLNDGSIFNCIMDTQNLWATYSMVSVLALDVYQHADARDFGASPDGRKQYVEAFFRNIDWDHVNRQLIQARRPTKPPTAAAPASPHTRNPEGRLAGRPLQRAASPSPRPRRSETPRQTRASAATRALTEQRQPPPARECVHTVLDRRAHLVSHIEAVDVVFALLALSGALTTAAIGLFGRSLRESIPSAVRGPARELVRHLRYLHSGHIGDYVAWWSARASVLGGICLLVLR